MAVKIDENISLTEIQIWPVRNAQASRVKAMVSITYNGMMRVSGCRIIEGAKGLFLSYPSEKKPGSDQFYPLFHMLERSAGEKVQDAVIQRFNDMVKAPYVDVTG